MTCELFVKRNLWLLITHIINFAYGFEEEEHELYVV